MFTGLVETVAEVRSLRRSGPEAQLVVAVELDAVELGESIAVSGVCLTVTRVLADGFQADVSSETLSLTTLGDLGNGSRVNIERATQLGGRMGGHMVLGHVDGLGVVSSFERVANAWRLLVTAPESLQRFLAAKGSVAIDGVSLTINRLVAPASFEVMLVPHTLEVTTLKDLRAGKRVNLEVDVLARYVARQLECAAGGSAAQGRG